MKNKFITTLAICSMILFSFTVLAQSIFIENVSELEGLDIGSVTGQLLPKWKSTSTDQFGNTINSIEPRGTKNVYIDANASTSASMDAATYCISGANCITSWPTSSGGAAWEYNTNRDAMITTSTKGFFITASSTVHNNFRIDGNATTTGSQNIGSLTAASCDVKSDTNGLLYCGTDATAGSGLGSNWSWSADQTFLYPSTTVGILSRASSSIDSNFRIDGNATTTNSLTFTNYASCDLETDANGLVTCGSDSTGTLYHEEHTATEGQTVFDLTSFAYTTGDDSLVVTVNGLRMRVTDDYAETDTDTITFVSGRNADDKVTFNVFGGTTPGTTTGWEYVWTGAITPTTTDAGIYVTASSTIEASLRVAGSVTTTEHIYTSDVVQFTTAGDNYCYFDNAQTNYFMWDDSADYFALSNDLQITGTASTTSGFRTNDKFTVNSGGSASTTDSLYIDSIRVYGEKDRAITFATSTLDYISGATSTIPLDYNSKAKTITEIYCITNDNNATIKVGDGTNYSAFLECDNDGETMSTVANGTYTAREKMQILVGNRSMTQWLNVILTENYD